MNNRTTALVVVVLLMLVMMACNLPTPTRIPVCTPPACAEDEVYYCPDVCPGGCDTECATPTPTISPTTTLMPACTPPACADDEVYYCPDECPGGCGTGCATLTPEPLTPTFTAEPSPTFTNTPEAVDTPTNTPTSTATPSPTSTSTPTATPEVLQIISFLSDKTSFNEGDALQVSWDVQAADSAYIEWVNQYRIVEKIEPIALPTGILTIHPYRGEVSLTASRGLDQVTRTLTLNIGCPTPWPTALTALYPDFCPSNHTTSWAAYQKFEHGTMIWVESEDLIYVLYGSAQNNTYFWYPDNWTEGDPESDPTIIPPAGLLQPVRGFGKIWRDNPNVRNGLGWATNPEQGYTLDKYQYGIASPSSMFDWISTPTGAYWRLHPYTHTWGEVAP